MCLVVLDFQPTKLTLLAHRDEVLDRPTRQLHQWSNGIIAGQDVTAGGTWFGVTPGGRWAILTNIPTPPGRQSRGQLVVDYLTGPWRATPPDAHQYAGFNLLVGQPGEVHYFSSHAPPQRLQPGLYVLGNAILGTDETRTSQAAELYRPDLHALDDLKLDLGAYGTRSTALLTIENGTVTMEELTYPSLGHRRIQVQLDHDFLAN